MPVTLETEPAMRPRKIDFSTTQKKPRKKNPGKKTRKKTQEKNRKTDI
jgi:hypothetical protein